MTISAKNVRFDETTMWGELNDGRGHYVARVYNMVEGNE